MKKKIAGQQFGYLTAVSDTGTRLRGHAIWHCKCVCGRVVQVSRENLMNGGTRSCGCKRQELKRESIKNKADKNINGTTIITERRNNLNPESRNYRLTEFLKK